MPNRVYVHMWQAMFGGRHKQCLQKTADYLNNFQDEKPFTSYFKRGKAKVIAMLHKNLDRILLNH